MAATLRFLTVFVWLCLLTKLTFQQLGHFPPIHGDEAWFGLEAIKMQHTGIGGTNGMKWYAGSIFPYIVSLGFDIFGVSNWSLRLPGALLSIGFQVVLTGVVWWMANFRAALFLLGLLSSSLLLQWYGRIAWEVNGLSWILIAFTIFCVNHMLINIGKHRVGRVSLTQILLVFWCWTGAISHFLFAIYIVALVLAAVAFWLLKRDLPSQRFAAEILPVIGVLPFLILKAALGNVGPFWVAVFFFGVPFLVLVGAVKMSRSGMDMRLLMAVRRLGQVLWRRKPLRWLLVVLGGAVLSMAAVTHGLPMAQVLSNVIVIKRLGVLPPGWWISLFQYGFAVLLVFQYLRLTWRYGFAVSPERRGLSGDQAVFLALVVVIFLMLLPYIAPRTSLRYFAHPMILMFVGLAIVHPLDRVVWLRRGSVVILALAAGVGLVIDQQAKRNHATTAPKFFLVGLFMHETDMHFLPTAPLEELLAKGQFCPASVEAPALIRWPLEFAFAQNPWQCNPHLAMTVAYCPDCRSSGYFKLAPSVR